MVSDADVSSGSSSPVVLVLDDEEPIRRAAQRILELYDYVVLTAGNAHDALLVAEAHPGPVHVLLCDLVLPGLGGREAANMLLAHHPEMKVLYTSGFSSHDSFRGEIEGSVEAFLPKPFEVQQLVEAVERLLES